MLSGMQQVIGQIVPLAVGIAISPLPIVAVILMLITPRARANGLAFLVGWMAGLAVVGVIALLVAGATGLATSSDASSQARGVIRLLLGLLLLLAALRQWRSRPRQGEEAPLPRWMASLDTFTPAKSLGLAALLSGVNPKNLALNLAAMSIIAGAGLSASSQAAALVVVVLIGSVGVFVPVGVYLVGGDRAGAVLGGWKAWLAENNGVIMAVLFVVLGFALIGQGIAQV